jgi:hypothetical protein
VMGNFATVRLYLQQMIIATCAVFKIANLYSEFEYLFPFVFGVRLFTSFIRSRCLLIASTVPKETNDEIMVEGSSRRRK